VPRLGREKFRHTLAVHRLLQRQHALVIESTCCHGGPRCWIFRCMLSHRAGGSRHSIERPSLSPQAGER
jgi:hypothetical protein